jgi:hypothetical protein
MSHSRRLLTAPLVQRFTTFRHMSPRLRSAELDATVRAKLVATTFPTEDADGYTLDFPDTMRVLRCTDTFGALKSDVAKGAAHALQRQIPTLESWQLVKLLPVYELVEAHGVDLLSGASGTALANVVDKIPSRDLPSVLEALITKPNRPMWTALARVVSKHLGTMLPADVARVTYALLSTGAMSMESTASTRVWADVEARMEDVAAALDRDLLSRIARRLQQHGRTCRAVTAGLTAKSDGAAMSTRELYCVLKAFSNHAGGVSGGAEADAAVLDAQLRSCVATMAKMALSDISGLTDRLGTTEQLTAVGSPLIERVNELRSSWEFVPCSRLAVVMAKLAGSEAATLASDLRQFCLECLSSGVDAPLPTLAGLAHGLLEADPNCTTGRAARDALEARGVSDVVDMPPAQRTYYVQLLARVPAATPLFDALLAGGLLNALGERQRVDVATAMSIMTAVAHCADAEARKETLIALASRLREQPSWRSSATAAEAWRLLAVLSAKRIRIRAVTEVVSELLLRVHIGAISADQLSDVMVQLARVGLRDSDLFETAADRIFKESTPSSVRVANVLYALALSDVTSRTVSAQCLPRIRVLAQTMAPRQLATTMFAFSRLKTAVYPSIVAAVVARSVDVVAEFRPDELAMWLSHSAAVGVEHAALLPFLEAAAARWRDDASAAATNATEVLAVATAMTAVCRHGVTVDVTAAEQLARSSIASGVALPTTAVALLSVIGAAPQNADPTVVDQLAAIADSGASELPVGDVVAVCSTLVALNATAIKQAIASPELPFPPLVQRLAATSTVWARDAAVHDTLRRAGLTTLLARQPQPVQLRKPSERGAVPAMAIPADGWLAAQARSSSPVVLPKVVAAAAVAPTGSIHLRKVVSAGPMETPVAPKKRRGRPPKVRS